MNLALEQARAAFSAGAWREAAQAYAAAAGSTPLSPGDHGRRATAAFLVGDDSTCERSWEEAYRVCGRGGRLPDGGPIRLVDRLLPAYAGPNGAGQRLAHPGPAAGR